MWGRWGRGARGWFLELRLLAVLLWSYTAVAIGTALAILEEGTFDLTWFLVAMLLGVLIQGWVTHAINEIYDWRSGTDRYGTVRGLSGGSKVLRDGLLDERGLWIIFAASTIAVLILAVLVFAYRAWWLVLLIAPSYILGVVYTVPPIATSYRPFLGEWVGGFPGVVLAGLGAYAIQTLTLSWTAVLVVVPHAFVCLAKLVVHHYLDAEADANARPVKRTTVVALGIRAARGYAIALVLSGAALYALLGWIVHPAFFIGALLTAVAALFHMRIRPTDLKSVTRNELRIVQLGLAAGLGTAVVMAPSLWPLLLVAGIGYLSHVIVAAPPRDLARAWFSKSSE